MQISLTEEMESTINKDMFRIAMEGKDWSQVVEIYEKNPSAHKEKNPTSGDTLLHIAVWDNQEDIVEKLVRLICEKDEYKEALKIKNERGNTPLHLAASMGSVRMCECIAGVDSKLVGAPNHDGETPFFLAALNGRKDAFLFLHSKCTDEAKRLHSYCRRNDGETILHCAIAGDYFELADKIIHLYGDLVNSANKEGITPLHLLASKPSAFKSGSHLSWWSKIIYHSITVEKSSPDNDERDLESGAIHESQGLFPSKYRKCFEYVTLKVGYPRIKKIKEEKEKHTWASLLVYKMVELVPVEYEPKHGEEMFGVKEQDEKKEVVNGGTEKTELEKLIRRGGTPLLVASKYGVTEMVEIILKNSRAAIGEVDSHGKNVVHYAVENRQFHVYNLLLRKDILSDRAFRHIDEEGNSALHLAATLPKSRPSSRIPGPALQMQWEIDWFKFIKKSFPSSFLSRYNHRGQTAEDVFIETHEKLVSQGSDWLNKTSQSCCVVATIIAPAAFSTSATISNHATDPRFEINSKEQLALYFFSISSLIALCSSIISLIIFLAIMNSRHRVEDFKTRLPRKFLVALSALLLSIITTLISFCSTHFLIVKDIVKFNVFPVYAFLWVAVPLIVLFQFPLYPDFLRSICSSIQARSNRNN